MTLRDALDQVLTLKGITAAAVVGPDGIVRESAATSTNAPDLGFVGHVTATTLASSQALAEFFERSQVTQTLVEFDEGPMLITPLEGVEFVLVTTLESANDLGRVRFQLRKLVPSIAAAALST